MQFILAVIALVFAFLVFWVIEVVCKCRDVYKKFNDNHLDIKQPLDRNIMKKVDAGMLQLKLTEIKGNGGE